MDYKEVKRLADTQRKILALEASQGNVGVRLEADGAIRLTADNAVVRYRPNSQIEIVLHRVEGGCIAFPDGLSAVREGNKAYLTFCDGTGKTVNYLYPSPDGVAQLERVADKQFKLLNPIQDYIIEPSKGLLKIEKAKAETMREYCRAMWPMIELPDGWTPLSAYDKVDYNDDSTWHNFVLLHKFAYLSESKYDSEWKLRSKPPVGSPSWRRHPCPLGEQEPPSTPNGLIRKINAHFEAYHTAYDVKKKSPYTLPHWNEHWQKLSRLREAGIVPE